MFASHSILYLLSHTSTKVRHTTYRQKHKQNSVFLAQQLQQQQQQQQQRFVDDDDD